MEKFKAWLRKYWMELTFFLVGMLAVHALLFLRLLNGYWSISLERGGVFGDFVGGYVGTLFSLVGIIGLIITLKEQRRSGEMESFENKYLKLLELHRSNVEEIELKSSRGRRVFVLMMREFRCILEIVVRIAATHETKLKKENILHISYYCLFYGVGPNSSRILKSALREFDPVFIDAVEAELNQGQVKEDVKRTQDFDYTPFEGHQSRLGHYYRHLFQTVQYVNQQSFDSELKYSYIKTVRAQLSTHEQALLLLNSRTPLGSKWWKRELITTYRLVKNIPQDFFEKSTELEVEALFGNDYFEWQDSPRR
jgi:hypothetical protein